MPPRIFIHANNVHQGGGRSLLLALLEAISVKYDWFATLDARLQPLKDLFGAGCVKWVGHSVLQRLNSEWWLTRHVQKNDVLLCFGNLPPLFRSRGRVIVFVQNRYLVELVGLQGHSVAVRLRIRIERWWLIQCAKNVDLFVVQTPTMKSLLQSRIARGRAVAVFPFVGANEGYTRSAPARTASVFKYDFLYVASGEPHKNHRNLIEAWCLLAQAGTFPSLCLTVDETAFPEICRWLQRKKTDFGLKMENLGSIPHAQIQLLYGQARAFIFTSAFESLGLPLIEARQAGLPVLAPELDYVRDVLDPEQVFDPASPISIARAVKRFLGSEERPLLLLDAEGFMNQILQGSE
jgi:glycosyltransferase involved in cell wall biosynthesis